MHKRLPALLTVLGFALLSACSSGDQTAGDTIPSATVSTTIAGTQLSAEPISPPELDPDLTGSDLLVEIEARWMCDVQRFAFPDLNAMNVALDERLAPHGLGRADYDTFKTEMETSVELRQRVLAAYGTVCG